MLVEGLASLREARDDTSLLRSSAVSARSFAARWLEPKSYGFWLDFDKILGFYQNPRDLAAVGGPKIGDFWPYYVPFLVKNDHFLAIFDGSSKMTKKGNIVRPKNL